MTRSDWPGSLQDADGWTMEADWHLVSRSWSRGRPDLGHQAPGGGPRQSGPGRKWSRECSQGPKLPLAQWRIPPKQPLAPPNPEHVGPVWPKPVQSLKHQSDPISEIETLLYDLILSWLFSKGNPALLLNHFICIPQKIAWGDWNGHIVYVGTK